MKNFYSKEVVQKNVFTKHFRGDNYPVKFKDLPMDEIEPDNIIEIENCEG